MHAGTVIVLLSKVTAAVCAIRRPSMVAPVFAVMDAAATIVPLKVELIPNVADDPTRQNTLQDCALLDRLILEELPVIKVDPVLKTNSAFGSPCASSVNDIDPFKVAPGVGKQ